MWYKRYGYKHPSNHGDGIGCVAFLIVLIVSWSIPFLIAVLADSPWFLLLVIPLAIAGFECSIRYVQGEGARRKEKRQQHHIKKAVTYMDSGKKVKALESIRRAKIYGDIPPELQKYEESKRSNN